MTQKPDNLYPSPNAHSNLMSVMHTHLPRYTRAPPSSSVPSPSHFPTSCCCCHIAFPSMSFWPEPRIQWRQNEASFERRAPCEVQVPVPASPCAKSQEGGWQLADYPPFYISSVLIFSRGPHLFCQPSSFRETALLNKAWVIYCTHHWNDATCFSSAHCCEPKGGCGFGS